MRRELLAKAALGCAIVGAGGSLAGIGLSNYVASGSFDFYKQARVAEWKAEPMAIPEFTFPSREFGTKPGETPEPLPVSYHR